MDRLKEIESRKAEIKSQVESLKDIEEVRKLSEEVDALLLEERDLKERKEERDIAEKIEKGSVEVKKIEKEEEKKMEKKFDLSSKEYRSAWAKTLMGLSEDKFTEEEKRALGDAVTTTATTFVGATADTQGINNGGLFIPTSVRMELMELISKESPIFNDIRKLQVAGNVDLPYLYGADDSNWYAELTDTSNEGMEFKNLQLTGWELAKDIVITWKLEEMAVESFISFILEELAQKMGKALINAVIYGDGSSKPTGITNGLVAITNGNNVVERILNTYKGLSDDAKVGAKVYISTNANLELVSYKDGNNNYPFLAGIPAISGLKVEVDPYLTNDDIVAGNMRNYDGKPRPAYFTLGRKPASV